MSQHFGYSSISLDPSTLIARASSEGASLPGGDFGYWLYGAKSMNVGLAKHELNLVLPSKKVT